MAHSFAEEWRSIREPIMDLLARSAPEPDGLRGTADRRRRPDPEDPTQTTATTTRNDDDRAASAAEDASGFCSSGSRVPRPSGGGGGVEAAGAYPSYSSYPSYHAGRTAGGRHHRQQVARPGEEPAGTRAATHFNHDGGTYYGASHRRDMTNHPKWDDRPAKDKDSDLEASGGYADHKGRVTFSDRVLRRQSRDPQESLSARLSGLRPIDERGILSDGAESAASQGSVEHASYNIAASAELRRSRSHNAMRRAVVVVLAVVALMAIALKAMLLHGGGVPETEIAAVRQRAALEVDPPPELEVMDVEHDIPLRVAPPEALPPSPGISSKLRGYYDRIVGEEAGRDPPASEAQMQLQIQKEMIRIQNDIVDAQARAMSSVGEGTADVAAAGAGEEALAELALAWAAMEDAAAAGGGAMEAEQQRVEEENAYRAAMDRQAFEYRTAMERQAGEEERDAEAEGVRTPSELQLQREQEHLRLELEEQRRQEQARNEANVQEDPPPQEVPPSLAGGSVEEGDGGTPPVSGAELEGRREESQLREQVVRADPQAAQDSRKEAEGEVAALPEEEAQVNAAEKPANGGDVDEAS